MIRPRLVCNILFIFDHFFNRTKTKNKIVINVVTIFRQKILKSNDTSFFIGNGYVAPTIVTSNVS